MRQALIVLFVVLAVGCGDSRSVVGPSPSPAPVPAPSPVVPVVYPSVGGTWAATWEMTGCRPTGSAAGFCDQYPAGYLSIFTLKLSQGDGGIVSGTFGVGELLLNVSGRVAPDGVLSLTGDDGRRPFGWLTSIKVWNVAAIGDRLVGTFTYSEVAPLWSLEFDGRVTDSRRGN